MRFQVFFHHDPFGILWLFMLHLFCVLLSFWCVCLTEETRLQNEYSVLLMEVMILFIEFLLAVYDTMTHQSETPSCMFVVWSAYVRAIKTTRIERRFVINSNAGERGWCSAKYLITFVRLGSHCYFCCYSIWSGTWIHSGRRHLFLRVGWLRQFATALGVMVASGQLRTSQSGSQ